MTGSEDSIHLVKSVSPELVESFGRLINQLNPKLKPPSPDELEAVIKSPGNTLLIAREGEAIAGTLTLVVYPAASGPKAWLEDIVVDSKFRGRGIGRALVAYAISLARQRGAKTVLLTSRPSRAAANSLYKSMGFKIKNTNCYELTI
jgi:ribosomal protein S18 acetylase RimI-like enzyme